MFQRFTGPGGVRNHCGLRWTRPRLRRDAQKRGRLL